MSEFIRVDDWVPSEKDMVVTPYNKEFVYIPFDKIFDDERLDVVNVFSIVKESYVNSLQVICHYINYFIKFYDKDNQLLMSYLKLRRLMRDDGITQLSFIHALYSIMFTDYMKEAIIKMVDDNYYIDLSQNNPDKKKKYSESLEFKKEHALIMMQISVSIKLMVPVVFHFLNMKNVVSNKKEIYRVYEYLFTMYGKDINIYNKLYNQVLVKVKENHSRNDVIWNQRKIMGTNPIIVINQFLHEYIIAEAMFKYVFCQNIISMNHVIIKQQLVFFLKEKYKEDRHEINHKRDGQSGGLSLVEKFEMSLGKIDEGYYVFSDVFTKKTIKRIKKELNMDVSEEELQYYMDNFNMTRFHETLIFYHYAKYFNGYIDINMLKRRKRYLLAILLKKRLLVMGYQYLPYILTANIEGKLNNRTIQNSKFLNKLMTFPAYTSLENKYYELNLNDKNNPIINTISMVLNGEFSLVDYDNQNYFGKPIFLNKDKFSCEILDYFNMI